jgi:hypothetical protein
MSFFQLRVNIHGQLLITTWKPLVVLQGISHDTAYQNDRRSVFPSWPCFPHFLTDGLIYRDEAIWSAYTYKTDFLYLAVPYSERRLKGNLTSANTSANRYIQNGGNTKPCCYIKVTEFLYDKRKVTKSSLTCADSYASHNCGLILGFFGA